MKYRSVKDLPDDLFRRLSGLKRSTFHKVAEILQEALGKSTPKVDEMRSCIEDPL